MIRNSHCLYRFATIALSLAVLMSCSRGAAEPFISQADLADQIGAHHAPLILDVRTAAEFESGHIPGAVNIPYTQISRRIGELKSSSDSEIVVYCEQGGRAARAAAELRRAGFSNVLHLEGDMRAWRERHLPCAGC